VAERTEKLTIQATAEGMGQAAAEVRKVEAAQDAVTGKSGAAAEATRDNAAALSELDGIAQQAVQSLNDIDPALGRIAQGLLRGADLAGKLATANVDLAKVGSLVTDVFTKYGGALKLLGAAGFAAFGFDRLVAAFKKVEEAAERSRKGLQAFQRAADQIAGESADIADRVIAERDTLQRFEPFSADEARAARRTIERAPADIRDAIAELVKVFGGAAHLGGGPLSANNLEDLARLGFEPNADLGPGGSLANAQRFLADRANRTAAIDDRQRRLHEADRRAAVEQGLSPDAMAPRTDFNRIIREVAEQYGVDFGVVEEVVRERLESEQGLYRKHFNEPVIRKIRQSRDEKLLTDEEYLDVEGGKSRNLGPGEVGAIRSVLERLLPVLDRLNQGTRSDAGTIIHNHNQFQRITHPSAKAQREAQRGAEHTVRSRER